MGLLGTGSPAFIMNQQVHEMPSPVKGSRVEDYKDETETTTNVLGSRIKFDKKLRFSGKYLFTDPDPSVYDVLVAVYNSNQQVMWIPHVDVPFVRYLVDIEKVKRTLAKGDVRFDNLEVSVIAVHQTSKIPSLDNMIKAVTPFNVAILKRS